MAKRCGSSEGDVVVPVQAVLGSGVVVLLRAEMFTLKQEKIFSKISQTRTGTRLGIREQNTSDNAAFDSSIAYILLP